MYHILYIQDRKGGFFPSPCHPPRQPAQPTLVSFELPLGHFPTNCFPIVSIFTPHGIFRPQDKREKPGSIHVTAKRSLSRSNSRRDSFTIGINSKPYFHSGCLIASQKVPLVWLPFLLRPPQGSHNSSPRDSSTYAEGF